MKIFKNIMLAVALLAMSVVHAKQVGGRKAQPTRVISTANQEQMLIAQEEALRIEQLRQELAARKASEDRAAQEKLAAQQQRVQIGQNALAQKSGSVSSDDWDEMEDEFDNALDSGDLRAANNLIKKMETVTDLTRQQKISLRRSKQVLKQQILIQAQTAAKKENNALRSRFSDWWSGETANVENYKNMILAKLDNDEKYPTFKSKQDALKLGVEFFDAQYNDSNIMQKAIMAATRVLPKAQDKLEQELINALNDKMRKQLNADLAQLDGLSTDEKISYLENYLKNNQTSIKTLVAANITNENVVALLRAIISETARINMMINSLKSLKFAQEKSQELAQGTNAEQAPISAPQGSPAGDL